MIYTNLNSAELGRVVFFPIGVIPDNKKYLRCGTQHLKSSYFPKLYNKFPFNLAKLSRNRFPNMTSNTAPAPYVCAASSEGSHYSSSSGTRYYSAWRAFNSDNSSMGSGHVGSQWRARTAPCWIQFTMPEPYYIEKYSIFSVSSTLSAHTCTLLDKNDKELATLNFESTDTQLTEFSLPTFTSTAIKTIKWAWNAIESIYHIQLYTVSAQEYIDNTNIFEIPEHEAPLGYVAYVYIGPDNPIDLYS